MHVLHRPHQLHRALLAAAAAAVLAIVLTLAIAGGLNDLGSVRTASGEPTSLAAAHAPAIRLQTAGQLSAGPLTRPFAAPVRVPWGRAH